MQQCPQTFRRAFVLSMVALTSTGMGLAILLGNWLKQPGLGGALGVMLAVAFRASVSIAVAWCRRQGWTGGGRMRQVLQPVDTDVETMPRVELPAPRGFWLFLAILCTAAAVLLEILPRAVRGVPRTEVYAYGAGAFFGLVALAAWVGALYRGPRLILDKAGITQRDPLHHETISWRQIAQCELTTFRDPCGEVWQVIARFQDERGTTVVLLNEARLLEPASHLEPLVECLHQRFPRAMEHELPLAQPA